MTVTEFSGIFLPYKMAFLKYGIFEMLGVFFFALFFLSLVVMPLMVLVGHILVNVKQRTAYEKCAKQVARCAFLVGWGITGVGGFFLWIRVGTGLLQGYTDAAGANTPTVSVTSWHTFMQFIQNIFTQSTLSMQAEALIWVTLLGATILMSCVYLFWRVLRNARILQQSLLIVTFFWYALVLFGTLCALNHHANVQEGLPTVATLPLFFFPDFSSNLWIHFWNVAPIVPTLSVALAGGMACLWLMVRRTRDDFGRDYYAQMLPWCAAWARNGWFLLWFLLAFETGIRFVTLLQEENFLHNPLFLHSIVFLLLWSIPGILWTIGTRSKMPLRHKFTFVLAFMLSAIYIFPLGIHLLPI